jgi:hypothetical protein
VEVRAQQVVLAKRALVVGRKKLGELASNVVDGSLLIRLGELAAAPRADVVIEDRWADVFRLKHVAPSMVAEILAETNVYRFELEVGHAAANALVGTILGHAGALPWRLQEVGLLGLWLDERKEHRLHVWAPGRLTDDPPIHDHPFDLTSTVAVGELVRARPTGSWPTSCTTAGRRPAR